MPKFAIAWNVGYGYSEDVVEVESEEQASDAAYENWKEEAEGNAEYTAAELPEGAVRGEYCSFSGVWVFYDEGDNEVG